MSLFSLLSRWMLAASSCSLSPFKLILIRRSQSSPFLLATTKEADFTGRSMVLFEEVGYDEQVLCG